MEEVRERMGIERDIIEQESLRILRKKAIDFDACERSDHFGSVPGSCIEASCRGYETTHDFWGRGWI